MAKKERIEEEELVPEVSPVENNEKTEADAPKAEVREATVAAPKVALVRIRTSEDVDSIIAGTHYKFAKDKEVKVPSDVAAVLCYARKAYRL